VMDRRNQAFKRRKVLYMPVFKTVAQIAPLLLLTLNTGFGSSFTVTPNSLGVIRGQSVTVTASQPVLWELVGRGAISNRLGQSTSFIAPAKLSPQHTLGGCPVTPPNSIFATRIDNLPVMNASKEWLYPIGKGLGLEYGIGVNVVDSTTPRIQHTFHYTTSQNGSWFPAPPLATRKRENGSYATDPQNDHHMLSVDRDSCHFYETYQDGIAVPSCPECTAASGWSYASSSYQMPNGDGATDAAGLPLGALIVHLSELLGGHIYHALRFTGPEGYIGTGMAWPASYGNGWEVGGPPMGTRYRLRPDYPTDGVIGVAVIDAGQYVGGSKAPEVTVTGCSVAPVLRAVMPWNSVTNVTVVSSGRGCVSPTISFGGNVIRSAQARAIQYGPAALAVITALQEYGMFLADNGLAGQVSLSSDITSAPEIKHQLSYLDHGTLTAADFQPVDESTLRLSPKSYEVDPNNPYQRLDDFSILIAADPKTRQVLQRIPIALQSASIGTSDSAIAVQAGTQPFQIPVWVRGTTTASLRWSLSSPAIGTIDANGVYSAPTAVDNVQQGTLAVSTTTDSNARAVISISVLPKGVIRIDSGRELGGSIQDETGTWLQDIGRETGSYNLEDDSYPTNGWGGITDQLIYQTDLYTWGDDITYTFHVPNGKYNITFMVGHCGMFGSYYSTATWDDNLTWIGPENIGLQGHLVRSYDFDAAVNYLARTPSPLTVTTLVSDTMLRVSLQATTSSFGHTSPRLNGLIIERTDQ
jgi:hypothetical protein